MFVGTLILVVVGLLVAYYCIRNEFMVSQSLVFINFAIFAVWAVIYRISPQMGYDAFFELGFRSMYLESPEFGLLTLISAMFMHGGPMHLLMNMLILILLGVPFEDRIGSRAFLRIYFISGIIGSLVTGSISVWNGIGLETINIGASGAVFGIIGGFVMAWLLGIRNLVPEGLENVFTLSLVFALFQISNALSHESGIVAVTIAGMVVGNRKTIIRRELMEFKEQMTVMLIGMLFVLLAADVRVGDVLALGKGGLYTVLALVFFIRPLNIVFGTMNSDLSFKQKMLLAWLAPRGIVAAAVASYFAIELEKNGIDGAQLRAMVFLLIAVTVLSAGLTGSFVANLLGLKRKSDQGWIILGANAVARALAKLMKSNNEEVILIDENPSLCRMAEKEELKVIYGNGLEENILLRAEVDLRKGAIGLSENEEVNMLFARRTKEVGKVPRTYISIKRDDEGVTADMVDEVGAIIPFARAIDLEKWSLWVRKEQIETKELIYNNKEEITAENAFDKETEGLILPLTFLHHTTLIPIGHNSSIKKDDKVGCLVRSEKLEQFHDWLSQSPFSISS